MSWSEQLGSGLTNATQNHYGCMISSYFIGDCLRKKSTLTNQFRTYSLNETNQILNSAYLTNNLSEDKIQLFEQLLYKQLFINDPHNRKLFFEYELPKELKEISDIIEEDLTLNHFPLKMHIEVNGLTVRVSQNNIGVSFPEESLS